MVIQVETGPASAWVELALEEKILPGLRLAAPCARPARSSPGRVTIAIDSFGRCGGRKIKAEEDAAGLLLL